MSEEKTIVSLFRTAIVCDSHVEDSFKRLQEQLPNPVVIQEKVFSEYAMEILEDINLRSLSINPKEKFIRIHWHCSQNERVI